MTGDELRRAYQREYYHKNKEKILKYQKEWHNKNRDKINAKVNERNKQRKTENPNYFKERLKQYWDNKAAKMVDEKEDEIKKTGMLVDKDIGVLIGWYRSLSEHDKQAVVTFIKEKQFKDN